MSVNAVLDLGSTEVVVRNTADNTNTVRAATGVNFCPVVTQTPEPTRVKVKV